MPGFFVQAVLAALQQERVELGDLQTLGQLDGSAPAMSWSDYIALLRSACIAARNPALGLFVGRRITESNLHMLGPIIVASTSLRSAIEHIRVVQIALFGAPMWTLSEVGDDALYAATGVCLRDVEADLALALVFCCAQRFVGPAHRDSIVAWFARPQPHDAQAYLRMFEQRVHFDAARTALSMPRALLDLERPGTDPTLAGTLRQMALERFANIGEAETTWAARLENALREHTQLVHIDFDRLAARWQLSARGLRRRVEREGTRILDVLNRVRFERARLHLDRGSAPLSEVAEALGYSDVSAFQRAFKRWAGVGPGQYREQHAREAAVEGSASTS